MREKEAATRIIFVRHGVTDFPIDRIYCDDSEDPELNREGVIQAEQAAEFLSSVNVAAIVASPLARTQATADIIAQRLGLTVNEDKRLVERRFGMWEGLYFNEIEKQYPELFLEWKCNQAEFKPEGGESVFDLLGRVTGVIDEVRQQFLGKTVLVVSHVGPIRVLLVDALGLSVKAYRQIGLDYASISCVDYGVSQNNLILHNFHRRHQL